MDTTNTRPEDNDKVLKFDMADVDIPELLYQEMEPGLRKNVKIHVLFDNKRNDPEFGSDAAIIKYLPGAFVPLHLHRGYEMVFVLEGEYIENDIPYYPGSLIIRAPGTTHQMRSVTGCTFLAMRDVPVRQLT
ncbi:MAG: cupin domain-containing protein [Pseudomonadota bacterium]|nr:cupin domain-containing protein [Pseudomonadota bacterium]